MVRCEFESSVVMAWFGKDPDKIEIIQCANEKDHVGDHLILVPS